MSDRPDLPPGFDPYRTLQVHPEADPEVVQAAYRRLARKFHPDVAPGPEAAARMVAINTAWELVGQPDRRAAWDAEHRSHPQGSGQATAAAPPGPVGGNGPSPSAAPSGGGSPGAAPAPTTFESVSRDWTSGRSTVGSGYDPGTMGREQGHGAAGTPPGRPSGSVLNFGRYAGWSIGEIARTDLEYLEWLDRAPIGRTYRDEIDAVLRRAGRRRSTGAEATGRRGLFRRP